MRRLSKSADEYYSALEAVADKQDELTQSLREQVDTISAWISEMMRSNLAPVQSLQVWGAEYIKQRQLAMATGASEKDVAGYLNYAKDYLSNQKTMGGEYKDIFSMVMRDVLGLQGGVEDSLAQRQLDAAQALSNAAMDLSKAGYLLQLANMTGVQGFDPGTASLDTLKTLSGNLGSSTIPSPYRPGQKLPGLEVVPHEDWPVESWADYLDNLTGTSYSELVKMPVSSLKALYGKIKSNTGSGPQSVGGGDITLELSFPIIIDGAEVDRITAKRVLSGGELQSAIDKRIRMVA